MFCENPASRFNLIPIIRGACSAFDPQISKSQYRAESDKTKAEEFLSKNIFLNKNFTSMIHEYKNVRSVIQWSGFCAKVLFI